MSLSLELWSQPEFERVKSTVQYSQYPISGAVVETGGRYLDFRFFSPYEIKMPSFYFDIDERKNCQQFITDVQVFKYYSVHRQWWVQYIL